MKEKQNKNFCTFYSKIGACRHGVNCSKTHKKREYSKSILISNLYFYPLNDENCTLSPSKIQLHLDLFYEDIFTECSLKYGEIKDLIICANVSDHLLGSIFISFYNYESAQKAMALNDRYYFGKRIICEYTINDFASAICPDYEIQECTRGGFCNFIHKASVTKELVDEFFQSQSVYFNT
ncbi:U2 small nuclear RNA auxillary factor [Spraguea lophii 42_110]|uniref:U2 small nuclear RNA auxillary factor n=1 Tax=Spraguea lophii (strain 42_110) TaxID=1358809 RepID=S7XQZ4_SPRLO|nr:U2 small nuclear RNA auxillary factor [Spraguea lophii 42_110]